MPTMKARLAAGDVMIVMEPKFLEMGSLKDFTKF
jgi:hypothetical protein